MPHATTLMLFAATTLAVTASPGPGVLYVSARSLSQGRAAGFASMLGIESAEVIWLVGAATGLAALLSASTGAISVVRYAGAAYLVYLGIQRWRDSGRLEPVRPAPLPRLFVQGFAMQLLNPKVAVFFLAFLPLFIDAHAPVAGQVAALGVVYVAVALVVDTTYVLVGSALSGRFIRSASAQKKAGRVAAVSFVTLGVAAAAAGIEPA